MKRFFAGVITVLLFSCGEEKGSSGVVEEVEESIMYFTELSANETGISFSNDITETDSFNYFNYEYMYNGGGVAVGDVNNDGLEDLYFTGNQVSDKLYLNKGDMKFEDVTENAIGPLAERGWHTGVVMHDINDDGWLDIYVSRSGPESFKAELSNLLFVNRGDGTFEEKSKEFGVDVQKPTTQSVFFDKDNDGDMDLYVMNHPYNDDKTGNLSDKIKQINRLLESGSPYSDVLLENNNGFFTDVTSEANLSNHGFGLGVAAADINRDGYTDLYISNDYITPDFLYINNGDGTFEDRSQNQLLHMSNFSMGNDVADFNNDGYLDIMTVDMVSEFHVRSKKNMGGMSTDRFWNVVGLGYHYQYMFNSLQLNNGNGTFSEIAQMAGVSKTDWSWAPLFADFNNDGFKDLFITNGYRRDARDNDYAKGLIPEVDQAKSLEEKLELMPKTKIENYMYMNNGDLTFSKMNADWNCDQLVNTNGAVYADLDNDGDLDLVLNNMDENSYILRNDQNVNNYVKFSFEEKNFEGVLIHVKSGENEQTQEFRTVRGYQSGVSRILHFGLGRNSEIDEVEICWPNGKIEILEDLGVNKTYSISPKNAKTVDSPDDEPGGIFSELNHIDIKHNESFVNDFEKEVLLPHKMSQLGPFISKGDVNSDGLEDFYLSGSRGYSGQLYLGALNGFKKQNGPWSQQKDREELGSVFFDIEGDGDLDLYVVSGSNEYNYDSPLLNDQLYINNGLGEFSNKSADLPSMTTSGQKVITGDYDNDGDLDLFIAGRQTPGYYPFSPRSYLLENDKGKLTDVTEKTETLMGPGMITDAEFVDLDGDLDLDLVVVGEWMSPSFYRNDNGKFVDISVQFGTENFTGWWTSVSVGDLNSDGKPDFVLGNIGMNNKFHPSFDDPLEIYVADFDANGTYDIVLGEYENGTCYPVRGKQCSSEQMPFVSEKFPTYNEFATADLTNIYGENNLENALHFSATDFKSKILISSGDEYRIVSLINEAQTGPLNAVLIEDLNNDGNLDILGCGNNYGAEVETPRYDGGRGFCLFGDGKGGFQFVSTVESGFFVNSDAKDMLRVNDIYVIVSNNSKALFFKR